MAAMGEATARILHQVKNPLQTILLHAEMLDDDGVAADGALRRELCQAIVGESTRMSELLAALSSYASGMGERLSVAPLTLGEVVRGAARQVARECAAEGVTVALGAVEEVELVGDAPFLLEALGGVIKNAREALREKGAGARIELSLQRRGKEAVIEVRDNGVGIEPERLGAVFEPFVTSKPKAVGLGLPMCREIVAAHGGRVELRSGPGVGTTVSLLLPLAPRAARSPQRA
jgi:signal transduction histidine kinase